MKKQEMFAMVEDWRESGLKKQQYVKEQSISIHKLNYWIGQYNKSNQNRKLDQESDFREIHLAETDKGCGQKILELTTPGGSHIVIYG